MLIQLFRDNYTEIPQEGLQYTVYDGYFGGTDASPNIAWFNTAIVLELGETTNLSSLATATNNKFGDVDNRSLKLSGYFRAKYTGSYIFYTTSDDASFLYVNNIPIVLNGGTHASQTVFGIFHMVAGRYYNIDIYYGESTDGQEFNAGYYEPNSTEIPELPLTGYNTTLTGVKYSGDYVVSSSQETTGSESYRAFNKTYYSEDRFSSIGNIYNKSSGGYNTYYSDAGTATTSLVGGGTYRGEWLQIELPEAIRIKHFKITRRSGTAVTALIDLFKVFGTNDPTTGWIQLYERTTPGIFWNTANVYEVKSFDIATNESEYKYYRLAVNKTQTNSAYGIGELLLYTEVPPTNTDSYIKNATGLTTYYDIDPENTTTLVETSANYPLTILDGSLQGLFRVSPLALYINRPNFSDTKHEIFYMASDELFNNFNGTYKNYIQLQEKPVANDIERKRFSQFSSDMSFECELDGKIEIRFRRGNAEPVSWRYAMVVLDVERIPTKKIS